MLVSDYEIYYRSAGIHELHSIGKENINASLAYSENRKLAEWALNRIEFQEKQSMMRNAVGVSAKATHDYFSKIHHQYEHDLRENRFVQNPVINDREAADLLFKKIVEDELKFVPSKMEVTIKAH